MVMAMPNPDPDDEQVEEIFSRMIEDLDLGERAVENMSLVVVSSLTDFELVDKFNTVKKELYERQELLEAKSETGRDLHSTYHACLLEMKKRGLA